MLSDIVTKRVEMKTYFSLEAKTLLTGLLEIDAKKRLGSGVNGTEDIKAHLFFKDINWQEIGEMKVIAPIIPHTTGPEDCTNIDLRFGDTLKI